MDDNLVSRVSQRQASHLCYVNKIPKLPTRLLFKNIFMVNCVMQPRIKLYNYVWRCELTFWPNEANNLNADNFE